LARDQTVQKLKGHAPEEPETTRYQKVSSLHLADKVVLGDLQDHFKIIQEERPDIIFLGYNQIHFVDTLHQNFQQYGLSNTKILRAPAHKPHLYKTSLLRKQRKKGEV